MKGIVFCTISRVAGLPTINSKVVNVHIWLNQGHCQFDLWFQGTAQQLIGKMVHYDQAGAQILHETDGTLHSYTWEVIQHISLAP